MSARMKSPQHHCLVTDSPASFCRQHCELDPETFAQRFAQAGYIGFDWPAAFGKTGWSRRQQLELVLALADNRCPLLPDSLRIIAPLVMSLADASIARQMLAMIRKAPLTWGFRRPAENRCDWLEDSDSFRFSFDETTIHLPRASYHLATCFSPALLLQEWLTGLSQIRASCQQAGMTLPRAVTDMEIDAQAGIDFFLRNSPRYDLQLALKINEARHPVFNALFQSLGYYALLAPEPQKHGNEPLPFARERQHLGQLRAQVSNGEMAQRDLLFEALDDV